jgi:dTDP-4-amino-4,6-dideoxygalactose transaminase
MNTAVFHSLGSNYSRELIDRVQPFISHPMARHHSFEKDLIERLAHHFDGRVLLTYKGRDAIELALRPLVDQRTQQAVITQGLACHAIEEGILRAGMIPVYADLEEGTLGPSAQTIVQAYERAKNQGLQVTAVFLQHTLGYANPVSKISRFCEERGLVLIADLAQSFGAKDDQDIELGFRADVVICSFGRDKVIDAVSGGAVIFRPSFWEHISGEPQGWIEQLTPILQPPTSSVFKEMLYPSLTRLIREQHGSGLGESGVSFRESAWTPDVTNCCRC